MKLPHDKMFKMALNHRTMYFEYKEDAMNFKENVAAACVEEISWEQYLEMTKPNAQA